MKIFKNIVNFFIKTYTLLRRNIVVFYSLKKVKNKEKIKVVFLAIHSSVWKVDTVFQRMLKDPYFEPIILVCPYIIYGDQKMIEEMTNTFNYFKSMNYPVIKSLKPDENWIEIKHLEPDIIFFTNPHPVTKNEYYKKAFKKYLCCYVPYYFMATDHAGENRGIYGSTFLLSMWNVFWPSAYHFNCHAKYSVNNGSNGNITGYPATEIFKTDWAFSSDVWKSHLVPKTRIIFAPHHTVEAKKDSLSSFIELSEFIKKLAIKYKDVAQWSFKPHPILKNKLYEHENWGKARTDEYFNFWELNDFTQLNEGNYLDLFFYSDAIIHDSSSFIVEYVFTGKPGLFLMNEEKAKSLVNEFGTSFLSSYLVNTNKELIEQFIRDLILKKIKPNFNDKLNDYFKQYYIDSIPSDKIIKTLKVKLSG